MKFQTPLLILVVTLAMPHLASADDQCPSGYEERVGYSGGSVYGKDLEGSCTWCADQCTSNPSCLSFEHSSLTWKCSINTVGEPTITTAYNDYIYCLKEVIPTEPIDCEWTKYSKWSKCKNGKEERTRTVKTQALFGGKACKGKEK